MTSTLGGATGPKSIASSFVVAGRLVLLLLAVVAVVAAFVLSRGHDRAASSFGGPYACPMHPEVTSRAPGECPVCRMALERVSASKREAGSAADTSPAAESVDYSFPESANQPSYKLIASAKRRAFSSVVRAPAWIESDGLVAAILYENQLTGLDSGERGRFFRAAAPAEGVDVHRTAEPPARWDSNTSRVQFRVDPGAPALEPGAVGWVQLAARSQELLAVPASAVLVSPQGPYVLVAAPDGRTFTRRSLEIGQVLAGFAIVVSGLREEERVVVGNVFFLNAERRLSEQADAAGAMQ